MTGSDNTFARTICRVAFLGVLASWIGAMLFFAAVTAPSAFAATASMPEGGRQIAGTVVRTALGVLNIAAYGLTPVCMMLLFAAESTARRYTRTAGILMLGVISLGLAAVISHGVVTSRLDALRDAMVVIDTVALSDPRRVEFDRLHHVSVGLLTYQLIAAACIFASAGWRWLGEPRRKHHASSR